MKRLAILVALVLSAACSVVSPEPGHESVIVRKPVLFGHGGIDSTPVKNTTKYVAWSTTAVDVNVQARQQEITFDDLFTSDGVPLDFHCSIQYRIVDSVKLVDKYGADDGPQGMGFFHRVLEQPFRSLVRDAVKKHGLNEMAINVTAAKDVDDEISARFGEVIAKTGVPIEVTGITLGRASPPDAIKHQRVATAEQEQRIKTEQQAKLAEDQRKFHELARADADNAYRESMHLNPDQYLQLEQIKMLNTVCAGGKCTFIAGGHAVPTINVK